MQMFVNEIYDVVSDAPILYGAAIPATGYLLGKEVVKLTTLVLGWDVIRVVGRVFERPSLGRSMFMLAILVSMIARGVLAWPGAVPVITYSALFLGFTYLARVGFIYCTGTTPRNILSNLTNGYILTNDQFRQIRMAAGGWENNSSTPAF